MNRKVIHYDSKITSNSITTSSISTNDTIIITERYSNDNGNTYFLPNKYVVNTYRVDGIFTHNLPTDDSIIGIWPRHSSSNLLPLFNSNMELVPRERISLNSYNKNTASFSGYLYRVNDTDNNILGWWPFNYSNSNINFAYSVLVWHTNITNSTEISKRTFIPIVYPNPAKNEQEIKLYMDYLSDVNISLYDIAGRLIRTFETEELNPGEHIIPVRIDYLASGVYFYKIVLGAEIFTHKIIKL